MEKQGGTFEEFWQELEDKAKAKGPKALAEFERIGHRFRIGGELSVLRTRLGMSQTQLATITGIDQAEISRIERGVSNATEDTLARLAKALDAELVIVQRRPVAV
jgi:predicted transcriptional regulator